LQLSRGLTLIGAIGLALWGTWAGAQAIYRVVGPDGKVSFTDQPSPAVNPAPVRTGLRPAEASAVDAAAWPIELRQASRRFPVTLYGSEACEPCASGRSLLISRGIPFQERSIQSAEDLEAFKRLSGGNTMPLLTIGSQQLKGFSSLEWTQFLDAAGYPATSQLPKNYRPVAPSPMVAGVSAQPASPAATAPSTKTAPADPLPPSPQVTPSNPAGIRF
jgi:glutaredoxin